MNAMDFWGYLILVLGFLGLFGLIESLVLFFGARSNAEEKQFKRRLEGLSSDLPAREPERLKRGAYSKDPKLDAFLKHYPRLAAVDSLLRQTGQPYSVAQLLAAMMICAVGGLFLGMVMVSSLIFTPLFLMAGGWLPLLVLRILRNTQLKKIETQLPDALDLLGQSMRAGHAFSSALRTIGTDGPEPIATEFRITSDEINFGATVREGILNLASRVNSMDMRYFALAVLIQNETGGNLSNLMLDLSKLIRERLKLRRTVKVLTAEGRLSGWILGSLPFLFAGIMMLINPAYISYFWKDPESVPVLKVMAALLIVGVIWIRQIINIRV